MIKIYLRYFGGILAFEFEFEFCEKLVIIQFGSEKSVKNSTSCFDLSICWDSWHGDSSNECDSIAKNDDQKPLH